jgi:UDPglucose 6-dehydrogenase
MRVTVIGCGYVGLVTSACLAQTGNFVVAADLDAAKIARLQRNDLPIYEPGLDELVAANQAEGRLQFTTDLPHAIAHGEVIIIAVGTPHEQDGSADLSQVLEVAREIGRTLERLPHDAPRVVVTKSTVPVGTAERVREVIRAETTRPFLVCANPEFLRQGAGVQDFMQPDRIVIGVDSDRARETMEELYHPFANDSSRLLVMDIPSAELTKYAANAILAARISFMNHLAELCDRVGADVLEVRRGMAADRRIGPAFLYPGPGYGGSCFPKDVKALAATARAVGMTPDLFEAIERVNTRQLRVLPRLVVEVLGATLDGLAVAVWGLAFKSGTDDMRESPAIPLVEDLLARGAAVRAHDPKAIPRARALWDSRVAFDDDPYAVLAGASALVVVTEWPLYRAPDFERVRSLLRRPVLIDGRNLYDPRRLRQYGFEYRGIGRGGA